MFKLARAARRRSTVGTVTVLETRYWRWQQRRLAFVLILVVVGLLSATVAAAG
jgi:hypothetical protein